uniref:basic salivary proline-rich protein 2-like n=1 Tax=Podarcis muralis TaxID=64176 RepID=UPI0010A0B2F3|nr:basic salivary proline-rich protein 2-like [Podarcis muralis]
MAILLQAAAMPDSFPSPPVGRPPPPASGQPFRPELRPGRQDRRGRGRRVARSRAQPGLPRRAPREEEKRGLPGQAPASALLPCLQTAFIRNAKQGGEARLPLPRAAGAQSTGAQLEGGRWRPSARPPNAGVRGEREPPRGLLGDPPRHAKRAWRRWVGRLSPACGFGARVKRARRGWRGWAPASRRRGGGRALLRCPLLPKGPPGSLVANHSDKDPQQPPPPIDDPPVPASPPAPGRSSPGRGGSPAESDTPPSPPALSPSKTPFFPPPLREEGPPCAPVPGWREREPLGRRAEGRAQGDRSPGRALLCALLPPGRAPPASLLGSAPACAPVSLPACLPGKRSGQRRGEAGAGPGRSGAPGLAAADDAAGLRRGPPPPASARLPQPLSSAAATTTTGRGEAVGRFSAPSGHLGRRAGRGSRRP